MNQKELFNATYQHCLQERIVEILKLKGRMAAVEFKDHGYLKGKFKVKMKIIHELIENGVIVQKDNSYHFIAPTY